MKTDLTAATVTLGTTSYTYDGTAKTPEVTVKLGGTTIASEQYEISYSNSAEGSEAANVRA